MTVYVVPVCLSVYVYLRACVCTVEGRTVAGLRLQAYQHEAVQAQQGSLPPTDAPRCHTLGRD